MPCPKCGSRDNLGEYDDHYFCFGCKYTKKKDDVHSLRQRIAKKDTNEKEFEMIDKISDLPRNAMKWLLSYGITQDEIEEYGFKWSPKKQMLVLLDTVRYWQGRIFDPNNPIKYLSSGMKPIQEYGTGDSAVLTEDILSAVKVARLRQQYCGIPLLGSTLSYEAEQYLVDKYKTVYIWLDRDKALNALRIKRKLQQRGLNARVVVTDLDPKEYSKEEIQGYLET